MAATNGRLEGPKQRAARAARAVSDEQTLADADQTGSDRDQAASDRDLADGGDAEEHEPSREIRRRSTRQRDQTSADRMHSADQRDGAADAMSRRLRETKPPRRDSAMAARDGSYEQFDGLTMVTGAEIVVRAAGQRKRAAQQREQSAQQRELAAADHEAAAVDREAAARERRQALMDRDVFARALAASEADPLTESRTRAAGLADLDRELVRCRRIGCCSLVVAYA